MAAVDEHPKGILIVLEDVGAQKIAVIREIRQMTGMGLKQAKTAADCAPSCVQVVATSYEAEQAVDQLRSVGARASAVSPDSALAQSATPISAIRSGSASSGSAGTGGFYRVGFWILLLVVLYLWLRSA